MKTTLPSALVVAVVAIAAAQGHAQIETTGDRIKGLVDEIDSTITSYEANTMHYEGDKQALQIQSDSLYEKVVRAQDQLEQESAYADLLWVQAQVHRLDWDYVQKTKAALFDVVPRLNRLAYELDKASRMGFASEGDYNQYRSRLQSFVGISAQVLHQILGTVDDPALRKKIGDAALSLQSAKFGLSGIAGSSQEKKAEVNETVRLLENAVAQLQNIESTLQQEKLALQLAGYQSMFRLALGRVGGDGPLSAQKLPDFVKNSIESIRQRNLQLNAAATHLQGGNVPFAGSDDMSDSEVRALLDDAGY